MNSICKNLEFSNALLTAEWEEKYQEIGKGTFDSSTLVDETEQMIVRSMKSINDNWNASELLARYQEEKQNSDKESGLGQCPACKNGYVTKISFDSKKLGKHVTMYKCSNEDCNFVIFQDYFGAKFIDSDIANMLEGNESEPLTLKSRAGKTYQAKFRLESIADSGKWHVVMVKDPNWKSNSDWKKYPKKRKF